MGYRPSPPPARMRCQACGEHDLRNGDALEFIGPLGRRSAVYCGPCAWGHWQLNRELHPFARVTVAYLTAGPYLVSPQKPGTPVPAGV